MAQEEEIILRYNADTKQASSNVEKLGEENDQTAESVSDVNDQLDMMPGAAGEAVKGVRALGAAFMKLLANPIVLVIAAIVAGLTALYKAFTRTALGGDTMAKVFEGLEAAIGPVLDALSKFVEAILAFDWNDISGSIDRMGESFSGLGDNILEAVENASRLVDLRRELREMSRELTVSESELTLEMDKQRSILDDQDRSIQERIAANERLQELNLELLRSREELIAKQMEEAKLQKEQAGLDDEAVQEAKDRIAELTAARNLAEAERFRIEKEFVTKRNDLRNQEQAQLQAEREAQIERENEQFREDEARRAEEFAITSERIQQQKIKEIQLESDVAMRKIAIDKEYTEESQKLKDERDKQQEEEFQLRVDIANRTSALLNALAGVAGKNVKLQKALGISSAVISTLTGATQVLADPGTLNPVQKVLALATILATGFAQVKRIASTPVPGQSSGGVGLPTSSGGVGSVVSQNGGFANSNPGLITDVAVVNQQEQPPVRAFVMEGEITSQQEATAAANAKADL